MNDTTPNDDRPEGLSEAAVRLWNTYTTDFDLDTREAVMLREAVHLMTEIDAMRDVLVRDGYTVPGSKDQMRPHPVLAEMAKSRSLLERLLRGLRIEG